ncbi:hypothetical protein O181_070396 [Austropuccinia psidii MF-1]|uniref:Homeobox domain-containing protein n=1 Tax=Austropuccinia psidii MF-1 TaxID=1389203 RepID=A0A9Q3I5M3_9BASI|nr:hypothetical protein [Austropuccinia psidii MF-1]
MTASLWKTISTLSNQMKNIILNLNVIPPGWDCKTSCNPIDDIPVLEFPPIPSMQPMLLQLALSESLSLHYQSTYKNTVQTMDENLQQLYRTTAPQFCENPESSASRLSYIRALRDGILNQRAEFVQRCWSHVLLFHGQGDHPSSKSTGSTYSASPSISSSSSSSSQLSNGRKGRPPMFTKEQTSALQTLLTHNDRYSSEEKELIGNTLGLTRDQVNRWFCNARARQKPYARPAKEHASSFQDTLNQYITSENNPDNVITNGASSSRPTTPGTNENCSEQSSNDSLNQDYTDNNICGINTHDQNSMGHDFGSLDTNSSSPEHLDLFDQYFIFPMEDVHSDTWAQQPIFG